MDIYELLFPLFKGYLRLKLNRDSLENSILGLYADMKGDTIEANKEKQEENIDYSRTIEKIYQPEVFRRAYQGDYINSNNFPRVEYFDWKEFNSYR